jgi:TnpA family transposase
MSAFAYRYVGREALPARLTEFDLQQFFQLTSADIVAIEARFRADNRAAVALQLVCLRALGRPLDRLAAVPRNLLRYLCDALRTPPLSIASLKTLYQRRQTLYEHQQWAREHLGIKALDAPVQTELLSMLKVQAATAPHADELVVAAQRWLYDHGFLIPGQRQVDDWARQAFAAFEGQMFATVNQAVPATTLKLCIESVRGLRPDGSTTHLEWLKVPSKRHGPTTLTETLDKIRYLKSLTVHEWKLDDIALPKLRAYAQKVQARRPAKTKELKESTQALELVCFLRMSLLELTDIAMHQTGRRSQDLVRRAANKAKTTHTRSALDDRQQALKAKAVLLDKSKSLKRRVDEALEHLAVVTGAAQGSFASHVRAALTGDHQRVHALLAGLQELEFGGKEADPGFANLNAWRDLQKQELKSLPEDFTATGVGTAWHELVHDADHNRGYKAFAACTMMSLRKSLRGGSVWIDHSMRFRDREQMLIPADEWERDRAKYLALLGLPADADTFIAPLLDTLEAGVAAVAEACAANKIEVGDDGMLHLPAVVALEEDDEPRRTRDAIYKTIGDAQFPDLLLEVDAATNFSEVLLGHRAESVAELLSVYAALLAHGTEIDAKGIAAMIPGLEAAQVSVAMRALETHGRLRRANEAVAEFQGKIPVAAHWGTGQKASADMMALDVSRHLWTARVDPRRRTYAAGIYTHVLDKWGIVYDQPIVLNERQAGVAIEGVEQHNRSEDRIRLSLLAVDTHGYTNAAMATAKGLSFDLCPRLRDLSERKLYLPAGFAVPEGIERITTQRVSLKAIRLGWDEFLRVLASIRIGRISAELALMRFGSAARTDKAHKAAEHLGRLLRSIFLCDYVTVEDFRREIHTLLSRGESVHQLQRAIHAGRVPHERGRRRDEMQAISGAHALLTNIVMAWNTSRMNDVVERLRKDGTKIEDAWLRRMGPAHFGHINFRGIFSFGVERYAQGLISQGAPTSRARHRRT